MTTLEQAAKAAENEFYNGYYEPNVESIARALKAALRYIAEHPSEEMMEAARKELGWYAQTDKHDAITKGVLRAALMAIVEER